MSLLGLAAAIMVMVAATSATLLLRDISAARLRARVGAIRVHPGEQETPAPARGLAVRPAGQRSERIVQFIRLLRLNPDIAQQNVIPWKIVLAIAASVAAAGFFYDRGLLGGPLAALLVPIEALLVARFIFGWERARFQRTLLEQIPEVMAMICRAVSAGIPFLEALRSVARDAPDPSREEFVRVINEVAIGQSIERGLWKLHERVELPEYAFFAVTISLQAQTGGSLVETLQNLQDLVRRRVALSKRGKALAAEARMSATILGILPFVAFLGLSMIQTGFANFFLRTPAGHQLLLIAFGFLGVGVVVMRQLIRRSLAP
jgi:tight adherence protein B